MTARLASFIALLASLAMMVGFCIAFYQTHNTVYAIASLVGIVLWAASIAWVGGSDGFH